MPEKSPDQLQDNEQEAVEAWFIHRGLPNLIHDYSASTDVFNRAVPVFAFLWLFNILGAYGDRFTGWYQAFAAAGAASILLIVVMLINLARKRRPFQVPDRVGGLELAAFVLAPAILPVAFDNGGIGTFGFGLLIGVAELLIVWFAFGFGLGAIFTWALGNLGHQLSNIFGLMIRSLPLLLVFTMFLFLNAELWQVAHDFTTPLFWVATGGLVSVALLFVVFRIPTELENISQFTTSEEVDTLTSESDAPISGAVTNPRETPPLSKIDRLNVWILAVFSIGVQIALVMAIVGVFYLLFGLVTVRPNTIEQWTTGGAGSIDQLYDITLFGTDIPLTAELLRVTGFLMAFTALQFTVSALTDSTYRQEFFNELTHEIREALAVRALYLERFNRSDEATSE